MKSFGYDLTPRFDEVQWPVDQDNRLFLKRDDQIDPLVSGNKLFKLSYNLIEARNQGKDTILTFGGAYSNHIAATAMACQKVGMNSIGIIRGERPKTLNPTLRESLDSNMKLHFVSRAEYRMKSSETYLSDLQDKFPDAYIVPEGGANALGIKGAKNILDGCGDFDNIVVAMGTGTTFAGMLHAANNRQKIIGIPILKNDSLFEDLVDIDPSIAAIDPNRFEIIPGYHFGGYAKYTEQLIEFMRDFHKATAIKLDPIYTSKAMYALTDLISKRNDLGKRILFIHTGGQQGLLGFEERFGINVYE